MVKQVSFYTKFGGSRTATDFGVIMGLDKDSVCKNRSSLFIYYIFADIPFLLQGEINSWGGRDKKISAPVSGSKVIKLFFMLNLADHEIYHAHEC